MSSKLRNIALAAIFAAGLGAFATVPAHAAQIYQPGDPTPQDVERSAESQDLYGTD
ncbi:MAG: hypothetical protein AAF942_16965 [Pseudomonadota bacterium]